MATLSEVVTGQVADLAFGNASAFSDVAAPTVAEVNTLTRIECWIPGQQNVDTPRTGQTVDVSFLCTRESYLIPSTIQNGLVTIPYFRFIGDGGSDEAHTAFDDTVTPPASKVLVICRPGFSGAGDPAVAAVGDAIDIYQCKIVARQPDPIGRTTNQMGSVSISVQDFADSYALAS